MGSSQSQPSSSSPTPSSTEAVRPSASPLNPQRQSILSYFFNPSTPTLTHDHLHPTALEVRLVSKYLVHLGIPSELIPRVLDQAEYWSGCRRQRTKHIYVDSMLPQYRSANNPQYTVDGPDHEQVVELFQAALVHDGGGLKNRNGNVWYLVSSPIGCTRRPNSGSGPGVIAQHETAMDLDRVWIRKCVIETLSKDQGWSSNNPAHYGTYEQSYSWFEISLLRGDKEVEGSRHSIQNNVHAGQYYKPHCNILSADHPTFRLAQPGDRIVLWVRAQYQGWLNIVKEAAITVFTSPYPPST
ncbi:hypothetical protein L486_03092 [Kwoniella mangroviensis CBS 10435]|uniref:Uncharacterized protein n=1 Tax=Kwoniella mangroviensis CBS 10435 TaxID=1331196 RepID=A0A1B9IT74_9TREE|nr:hypothetical protein L486_03092 [Kwoniella mangroviensis CBS 10435]OCF77142.1 hypothetical protein I204_02853 [Kwoniella mangroviensis CBS 8886]